MHLLPDYGVLGTTIIVVVVVLLTVAELLVVAEFSMIEGVGWEVVISLTGGFLDLDRSSPIIFFSSGTGMGLSSLLGGTGHDLVTNKCAEAGKVEGHGVVTLDRLDIMGGVMVVVVTTVVGIRVADTQGSTRGFSINCTLFCLLCAL